MADSDSLWVGFGFSSAYWSSVVHRMNSSASIVGHSSLLSSICAAGVNAFFRFVPRKVAMKSRPVSDQGIPGVVSLA